MTRLIDAETMPQIVERSEQALTSASHALYSAAYGLGQDGLSRGLDGEALRNRAAELRARADQVFKAGAELCASASSLETLASVVHGSVPSISPGVVTDETDRKRVAKRRVRQA